MLRSGITFQQIEKIVLENRVVLFYKIKQRIAAVVHHIESVDIDDEHVSFWKQTPSRYSITACFLLQFWESEALYNAHVCCKYTTRKYVAKL